MDHMRLSDELRQQLLEAAAWGKAGVEPIVESVEDEPEAETLEESSEAEEVELEEGKSASQFRAEIPVIVVARINLDHDYRSEVEYEEDLERSKVVSDIKRRFGFATEEVANCIYMEPFGEEEARTDSNKHKDFVRYVFTMRYKEQRIKPVK